MKTLDACRKLQNWWCGLPNKKKGNITAAAIIIVGLITASALLAKYGYLQTGGHMFADVIKNKFYPFLVHQATNFATVMKTNVATWAIVAGSAGGIGLGAGSATAYYKMKARKKVNLFS
jgi:hypothetical protein